jgi:outer membrane lipoprotein-sorting protein
MIKFLPLILLFTVISASIAQENRLMLQKQNKNKNTYYKRGDLIAFQRHGNNAKITSEILYLKDSVIVFKGFEVAVNDISCLYIDEKTKWWLRYKLSQLALIGGTGYLLLDVLNTGELNNDVLIVSGTIIGIGLLAKILIGNKIKIKGKTQLKILSYQ